MSDHDALRRLLAKLKIEDKYDEVLNKKNINGPTTKFDEKGKLVWLDLSNFGITTIPEKAFSELASLQELKLFKNQLTNLPEDIFDDLTELTELHLKDNQLSSVTPRLFEKLSKLNRLFLLGNPLPGDIAKVYPNKMAVDLFLSQLGK